MHGHGHGAPVRTAEHVYPQWISRRYMKHASPRAFFSMDLGDHIGSRLARTLNQTIKVCADCNSGWMSQLEASAQPVLAGLVEGKPMRLFRDDQHTAARWLVKNALMHELCVDEDQRVVTSKQVGQFREVGILRGWSVHLAASGDWLPTFVQHLGPVIRWAQDDGRPRGAARFHTTKFDRLISQVLVFDLDVTPTFDQILGGPDWSTQLWPPAHDSVQWPLSATFSEEYFERVADVRLRSDQQDSPGGA